MRAWDKANASMAAVLLLSQLARLPCTADEPQPSPFGTYDHPAYKIVLTFDEKKSTIPVNPASEIFRPEIVQEFATFTHVLTDISKTIKELQDNLRSKNASQTYAALQQAFPLELRTKMYSTARDLVVYCQALKLREKNYAAEQEEGMRVQLGENEVLLAKKVFAALTGKEMPAIVTYTADLKQKGIVGLQEGTHISYKNCGPLENLLTLFHENSHEAALSSETFGVSMPKDSHVLEEACAYAGAHACLHWMSQQDELKNLAKKGSISFDYELVDQVRKFAFGQEDEWRHYEAMSVFLAAEQVFENPYETFNYLQTVKDGSLKNLNARIVHKMEINRQIASMNLPFLAAAPETLRDAWREYLRLADNCRRYSVKIDPLEAAELPVVQIMPREKKHPRAADRFKLYLPHRSQTREPRMYQHRRMFIN